MEKNNASLATAIQNLDLKNLLEIVLDNPMAHVNRVDFLAKIYNISDEDVRLGKIQSSLKEKEALAKRSIKNNITKSTSLSFASGIPGGLALAGTIPADILQNMIFSIRLIQELAYIYEYEELIDKDGDLQIDGIMLFLGAMFSAQGAGSLIRIASVNAANFASKKIMTSALMKTVWYPLLKNISKVVASKTLTKKALAGAATKAIPLIGGVASGGLTAVTMSVAAKKLNAELVRGYKSNYSEDDFSKDIEIIEAEFEEIESEEDKI